ncbi:hypothetical protein B0H12DRAFT_1149141, partial [Mycena haematopus]
TTRRSRSANARTLLCPLQSGSSTVTHVSRSTTMTPSHCIPLYSTHSHSCSTCLRSSPMLLRTFSRCDSVTRATGRTCGR